MHRIAKVIGCSDGAVYKMAMKHQLGPQNAKIFTLNGLAAIFNIERGTIQRNWIDKCGLKSVHFRLLDSSVVRVEFDDLIFWLKNNKDSWDSRGLKQYALGQEFKWLQEKRAEDAKKPKYGKWTTLEVAQMVQLFEEGKSSTEISKILNRTVSSVLNKKCAYTTQFGPIIKK